MKEFFIFFSAFLFVLLAGSQAKAQLCAGTKVILLDTLVNDGDKWQLEFEDDFNDSTLNLSKWKLSESSQGSSDGTGAYNSLDNVIIFPGTGSATGVCSIVIKKEQVTRPAVSWDPNSPVFTYEYTSSNIASVQQFGWGKYEIRCRIPKGKGFFPAFWMYGEHNGAGNEIDVFEFMNEKNALGKFDKDLLCKIDQMHYHVWDKTGAPPGIDRNCGSSAGKASGTDYSLDYHIYTVTWDRWAINWYVDGKLLKTAGQWYGLNGKIVTPGNIKPSQVVLRNDWYPTGLMAIIVNVAVQHGNDAPDESTPFPGSLDIDYIRYYRQY
ncbi:MAG: glycoside hydrolase family 16 [Bacteroidetes bacterium]|nr:glycoside hydrolase family 16 [Bacteroidota bacterium]